MVTFSMEEKNIRIIKSITILLLLLCSLHSFAQNESVVIYNNNITHDNLKANIYKGDTTYIYTVSIAAMWTGKVSTKIIYEGNYDSFISFIEPLVKFADKNKDNLGIKTSIQGIVVESTRKYGTKCIAIGSGDDITYTRYKSLKKMVDALDMWLHKNRKKESY